MNTLTLAAGAETASPLDEIRLPLRRVQPIDAFRGVTILLMLFVNTLNGVRGMPAWLYHTPPKVDGMTFPDGVFPAFLFIVGMSIPFACSSRGRRWGRSYATCSRGRSAFWSSACLC
jgi:predicted acyltransferase